MKKYNIPIYLKYKEEVEDAMKNKKIILRDIGKSSFYNLVGF